MKTSVKDLLGKQMTRVEFLRYFGMVVVGVFGISSLLKNLSDLDPKRKVKQISNGKRTFGSGAYGV